jgi:mono/diheme cytochrome c family protein
MRVIPAISAISVISLIGVTAASSASSLTSAALRPRPRYETTPQFLSSPTPQSADTANLYRVHCQMCHGPNGKALIPEMAFVGRKWKHGTKSADMAKIITEGVKGTPMLPFKSKMTAAQIRALARYVRAFDKTLPPEK